LNIILLGAPGSGKGTQAKRLCALFGLRHLSTGDLIRAEIAEATPLGLEIQEIVERGDLPSDSVALSLIEKDLSYKGQGVIFDGFPRTLSQAESLNQLVDRGVLDRPLVIKIDVEESLLIERLSGRWMCGDCGAIYSTTHLPQQVGRCDVCGSHSFVTRKDDEVSAIHHRLRVYHEKTEPVQGYYETQGRLMSVNGVLSPGEVEGQLVELLKREEINPSASQTS
jgi:adenylate kinase